MEISEIYNNLNHTLPFVVIDYCQWVFAIGTVVGVGGTIFGLKNQNKPISYSCGSILFLTAIIFLLATSDIEVKNKSEKIKKIISEGNFKIENIQNKISISIGTGKDNEQEELTLKEAEKLGL